MHDVDMESVGSLLSRLYDYGHEHREPGNERLPHVATEGAADSGGLSNQRIRMYAMAELKEFAEREKNEKQDRNWNSKVKSTFLCDQAPYAKKCMMFSDHLTGPARDWYN